MRNIPKSVEKLRLKTHLGVLIIRGSFEKTIMRTGEYLERSLLIIFMSAAPPQMGWDASYLAYLGRQTL